MHTGLTHTMPKHWYVYILRCQDGSFYTGVTTDLVRRLAEHNHGSRGARYTRARRPVQLCYQEHAIDRSQAQQREHALRKLSAAAKRQLVQNAGT
ncbi:MAG: GIY-YIG nuclease family protein [Thiohalomonadaceae bacterium]